MEFKVNSKELEKLLNRIFPAVPSRTPMPILENFLFEIKDGLLTIYATDLEISLKSSLNVVADEDFKMVVPARLLFDFVKSLKETTIHFKTIGNGKLNLTTDIGKYSISYLDAGEFPEIPTISNAEAGELNEITINGDELKEAFERSAFAISKEEIRPAMMGVLFEFGEEGLRFVTTDGHRLVNLLKKNIKLDSFQQYIVPERAVSVLTKILDQKDVNIYFTKTHAAFKLTDIELITRLIGYKYPDYMSVIPLENEFLLKVKTKELHESIRRMMLFTTSNLRKVKLTINKEVIDVSAEDVDLGASGEEKVTCDYKGEPIEIGFNSAYLSDILTHLGSEEEIRFKLHSPTKAVIIEPVEKKENQELMMLLMPVRLNN
ncbi:DNA polymerase III subunit beta [Melioribacteraceae bacterium 4301-Me]|uniref:DNA polymerase III subunit beta n=1 Tax=Pyranulibacter aquaticus TaxID=3163344 RepID=UPI003596F22F